MLYEFNRKFYIKPFSNKLFEVDVIVNDAGEFEVKPNGRMLSITLDMKSKIFQVPIQYAFEKTRKGRSSRKIGPTI